MLGKLWNWVSLYKSCVANSWYWNSLFRDISMTPLLSVHYYLVQIISPNISFETVLRVLLEEKKKKKSFIEIINLNVQKIKMCYTRSQSKIQSFVQVGCG